MPPDEGHSAESVRRFKCPRCGETFDWALDAAAHSEYCPARTDGRETSAPVSKEES